MSVKKIAPAAGNDERKEQRTKHPIRSLAPSPRPDKTVAPAVHKATDGRRRSYRACSIKRSRRTKDDIDTIKAAISEVLAADHPQTVRQVFYPNWSPVTWSRRPRRPTSRR